METSKTTDFEQTLGREFLLSEWQRARALAIVLGVLLIVATGSLATGPAMYEVLMHHRLQVWVPFAILTPFIAYELAVVRLLGRRLAMGRDVPDSARYFNALVETSLPSVVLMEQMLLMGPEQALGFLAPLLYFFFIILSTLRLDFWLSTFTGAVAAAELLALALLRLGGQTEALHDPFDLIVTVGQNLMRSGLLLTGGVLAGCGRAAFTQSAKS